MPTLALLFGCACIAWMFRRDRRWRHLSSHALWIPGIWLALASSRQASFWLAQVGIGGGASNNLEGSPINVVFNGSLFVISILVLARRKFGLAPLALANKALFSVYFFFLCSTLWSPFPVPTVKRVIQEFGSVLIAPIVLTEKDPATSLRVVLVRVSYVLFPLSVVFIRFFPDIGRVVSYVSGTHMACGVAEHKNSLGQLTMVFCLALLWDLMESRNHDTTAGTKPDRWGRLANLAIGLYLLVISNSATALMCFLLGTPLLFASRRLAGMKNARRVFMLAVVSIVCLLALEQAYEISGRISVAMDRGPGLTGRTDIWRVVLQKNTNYLVGAGFRGFWETSEGESVSEELGTNRLMTAHNGYLETYLNGGLVGLLLLGAFIWSMGLGSTARLVKGDPIGRVAVVFWSLLLIYNVTESQFFQSGSIWVATLMATIAGRCRDSRERTVLAMTAHREDRRIRLGGPSAIVRNPVRSAASKIRNPSLRWKVGSLSDNGLR